MGKWSQIWNKPKSRRMLENRLNELVEKSMNHPVEKVTVCLVVDFDYFNTIVVEFDGPDMKNNLFSYLMNKSLTGKIIDIYGIGARDMMEVGIDIQTFADGRVLSKTNIDYRMMELFEKMRMM